jgi:hypothetical protein
MLRFLHDFVSFPAVTRFMPKKQERDLNHRSRSGLVLNQIKAQSVHSLARRTKRAQECQQVRRTDGAIVVEISST